jgi:uncharacterized protein (DUF2267 family)
VEAPRTDSLDRAVDQAHDWLHDIARGLGSADVRTAYFCLRAVLRLIRDRLPIAQSAALGARLPLLIRGIYFESWRPHESKPQARQVEEFLGLLERDLRAHVAAKLEPERVFEAVADRLRLHLEAREVAELVRALPPGLRLLFTEARRPTFPSVYRGPAGGCVI